jgi:hypothetical protein
MLKVPVPDLCAPSLAVGDPAFETELVDIPQPSLAEVAPALKLKLLPVMHPRQRNVIDQWVPLWYVPWGMTTILALPEYTGGLVFDRACLIE